MEEEIGVKSLGAFAAEVSKSYRINAGMGKIALGF